MKDTGSVTPINFHLVPFSFTREIVEHPASLASQRGERARNGTFYNSMVLEARARIQ